jgi:hypothetical protein
MLWRCILAGRLAGDTLPALAALAALSFARRAALAI